MILFESDLKGYVNEYVAMSQAMSVIIVWMIIESQVAKHLL